MLANDKKIEDYDVINKFSQITFENRILQTSQIEQPAKINSSFLNLESRFAIGKV